MQSLTLSAHAEGVLLPVHAQPGARRNGIVGVHNGSLKVAVTQVAEKGKANDAILKVLAKGLGLRKSQVELVSGATNPKKVVLIRGETEESLTDRLNARFKSSSS